MSQEFQFEHAIKRKEKLNKQSEMSQEIQFKSLKKEKKIKVPFLVSSKER